jgi:DNA-binding phage protein
VPTCVTFTPRYDDLMTRARTAGERYLAERHKDADYHSAYSEARRQIDQVDALIRALDQRRAQLELSKAELARRSHLRPEVVRRLFSARQPNPTLVTVVALAEALDLQLATEPAEHVSA